MINSNQTKWQNDLWFSEGVCCELSNSSIDWISLIQTTCALKMDTHSEKKPQQTTILDSYCFCIFTLCILNEHSKLKILVWNIQAAHEGVWSVCDDEAEHSSFSSSFFCISLTACHYFSLRPTLHLSPILWVVGAKKNKINVLLKL